MSVPVMQAYSLINLEKNTAGLKGIIHDSGDDGDCIKAG
jgi:hypothetical protein